MRSFLNEGVFLKDFTEDRSLVCFFESFKYWINKKTRNVGSRSLKVLQ